MVLMIFGKAKIVNKWIKDNEWQTTHHEERLKDI